MVLFEVREVVFHGFTHGCSARGVPALIGKAEFFPQIQSPAEPEAPCMFNKKRET